MIVSIKTPIVVLLLSFPATSMASEPKALTAPTHLLDRPLPKPLPREPVLWTHIPTKGGVHVIPPHDDGEFRAAAVQDPVKGATARGNAPGLEWESTGRNKGEGVVVARVVTTYKGGDSVDEKLTTKHRKEVSYQKVTKDKTPSGDQRVLTDSREGRESAAVEEITRGGAVERRSTRETRVVVDDRMLRWLPSLPKFGRDRSNAIAETRDGSTLSSSQQSLTVPGRFWRPKRPRVKSAAVTTALEEGDGTTSMTVDFDPKRGRLVTRMQEPGKPARIVEVTTVRALTRLERKKPKQQQP